MVWRRRQQPTAKAPSELHAVLQNVPGPQRSGLLRLITRPGFDPTQVPLIIGHCFD
jgi:hypothetical protein